MKRCFLSIFFTCLLMDTACGQNLQKMAAWQDSLAGLGQRMFSNKLAEAERLETNYQFVKTLVSALQEPNAFFYKFDRLEMISILDAPQGEFRIFSWNIPLSDGSYLYYGAIQHKVAGGKLRLTPLLDKTFDIAQPETAVTSHDRWYGAQYYEIVALAKDTFALLGWKGHHPDYTHKVIEILQIGDGGNIRLGAPVFSDDPRLTRKIFAYSRSASMFLQHNVAADRIEFDHIVPISPAFEGDYKHYGPDLTHDAYEIVNSRLLFRSNVDIANPLAGDEDDYIDPLKPNNRLKSGF